MVGGGAGGVEVSLALNHRLKQERLDAGKGGAAECSVSLFTSSHILTGHTPAARRKLLRIAQVGCWTNCTQAIPCYKSSALRSDCSVSLFTSYILAGHIQVVKCKLFRIAQVCFWTKCNIVCYKAVLCVLTAVPACPQVNNLLLGSSIGPN